MKTHADREACWTDLNEGKWNIIEPWVPAVKEGERPADSGPREIVNGIRHLNRAGCAWRLLPHELPPSVQVLLQRMSTHDLQVVVGDEEMDGLGVERSTLLEKA